MQLQMRRKRRSFKKKHQIGSKIADNNAAPINVNHVILTNANANNANSKRLLDTSALACDRCRDGPIAYGPVLECRPHHSFSMSTMDYHIASRDHEHHAKQVEHAYVRLGSSVDDGHCHSDIDRYQNPGSPFIWPPKFHSPSIHSKNNLPPLPLSLLLFRLAREASPPPATIEGSL